jgi:hypothetical protein
VDKPMAFAAQADHVVLNVPIIFLTKTYSMNIE